MAKRKKQTLESYESKRDFSASPEPTPKQPARRRRRSKPVFVVHRHDARRLHYDLRLEMDGVLKSWAVPKGISFNPRDKRLAIRTEDHPLQYEDFHGVIPAGQYGAGTLTIWDRGTFELPETDDGVAAIEAGKLEVVFYGARLRGEWHMVRMKGSEKEWLLFKSKDRYARGENDSVFALDLTFREKVAFPRDVKPMLARRPRNPRAALDKLGVDCLYELKLAGRRVIVEKKRDNIRIVEDGASLSRRLPGVVNDLKKIRAQRTILDGVLVCLDQDNRPSQSLIDQAIAGESDLPICLYVFDVLYYEDWDLRSFPLSERKAALKSITPATKRVLYVDHERSKFREFLSSISAADLPGVIAKRASSKYKSGRSDDWLEVRSADLVSSDDHHRRPPEQAGQSTSKPTRRVKFTNRGRVLWPQGGFTKGDLIDYYDRVADALLPYLKNRPLSLNRYPSGIEDDSFYQKNTPAHAPDWIESIELASDNEQGRVRYVLCNDRDTLLYLANLASIELHPWHSQLGSLDSPDWAVLDLDPFAAPLKNIVKIAREIGKVLHGAGLRSLLKTSGSKGFHIYVPLQPGYSYEQSRMFCEAVARLVVGRHPKIATIERSKPARVGKVYIDYLQNRQGQTIVAPYVVRPVPGASVSAPLDWDELNSDLEPQRFTINSMPERLEQLGDLFAPALHDQLDLTPAIDKLRDMVPVK